MAASGSGTPTGHDVIHVAAADHVDALIDEISQRGERVVAVADDLVFVAGAARPAAWARNSWLAPRTITIDSIGDGARALRALQRNWTLHPVAHHRRAQLIADRLPPIRFRALTFPADPPTAPLGGWTLWDRHTLIASPVTTSAFADGTPAVGGPASTPPRA